MPSTGAAAQALLSPPNEGRDPFKCAAICSSIIATIFGDLEVLHEGIQDAQGDLTPRMPFDPPDPRHSKLYSFLHLVEDLDF